ncbi:MAG: ATP-binding protein [Ruminococcus sp.]|jgi:DNA polymerase III delta prime subunit
MNIQEAKTEIKRTLKAYTAADGDGIPLIPVSQQRPVLLIGPPGIGKTAIMQQIAREESIGLVSYTMTHHTRQSAIGLPMLKERTYQNTVYTVTEYTMSEIVASVYDCMENTGFSTGILFIDEINCVSETLAPVMLQLLQNKTFGNHRIPEGWLIVAAGNPPEYNKSVREFDIVTLDRVRHMEIEADLSVWKQYARQNRVHPSILAFLNLYPDSFYLIDAEEDSRSFVTARGWEDLSRILTAYEQNQEPVGDEMMIQYLQHEDTARNFSLFYRLFRHYADDFAAEKYFSANAFTQMTKADATEAVAVASMLFSRISSDARTYMLEDDKLRRIRQLTDLFLSQEKSFAKIQPCPCQRLEEFLLKQRSASRIKEDNGLLSLNEKVVEYRTMKELDRILSDARIASCLSLSDLTDFIEKNLKQKKEEQICSSEKILNFISHSYELLEAASYPLCLTYFTADLSDNPDCSAFLAGHPCAPFLEHCEDLLIFEKEEQMKTLFS